MEHRPSLFELFRRDPLSRALVTFTSVFALLLLIVAFARGPVTGDHDPVFSGIFAASAWLAVLGCGCWALGRLLRLRRLVAEGVRVAGKVLLVDSVTDGGWYMTLLYSLDGRPYRTVIGMPSRPRYEVGEVVALLADPRQPTRAILEEAYCEKSTGRC